MLRCACIGTWERYVAYDLLFAILFAIQGSGIVEGIELLHQLLLYLVIRNHCSKLRHIRIPLLPIVIQELVTHGHTPHC